MQSRSQTAWDVIAWDVLGTIAFRVLVFAGFYALATWAGMLFWGVVGPRLGLPTSGYDTALIATIGLWVVVGPMAWLIAFRVKRGTVIEF